MRGWPPSSALFKLVSIGPQGGASVRLLPVGRVLNPGKMVSMCCIVGENNTGTREGCLFSPCPEATQLNLSLYDSGTPLRLLFLCGSPG